MNNIFQLNLELAKIDARSGNPDVRTTDKQVEQMLTGVVKTYRGIREARVKKREHNSPSGVPVYKKLNDKHG